MDIIVDAFIEIPKGSSNKYEYDEKRRVFVLDRALFSPPCFILRIMDLSLIL